MGWGTRTVRCLVQPATRVLLGRSDGQARPSEDPEPLFPFPASPWLRRFLAFFPLRDLSSIMSVQVPD